MPSPNPKIWNAKLAFQHKVPAFRGCASQRRRVCGRTEGLKGHGVELNLSMLISRMFGDLETTKVMLTIENGLPAIADSSLPSPIENQGFKASGYRVTNCLECL